MANVTSSAHALLSNFHSWPLKLSLLASACLGAPAIGHAQESAASGERLYISKGCLGCHGASARGGVGPSLAQTPLSFEAFVDQLRSPREIMPAFPATLVTDEEASAIYEYLHNVAPAALTLATQPPSGPVDPGSCADCHADLQPTIVRQFLSSAMGRPGAQNPAVEFPQRC